MSAPKNVKTTTDRLCSSYTVENCCAYTTNTPYIDKKNNKII